MACHYPPGGWRCARGKRMRRLLRVAAFLALLVCSLAASSGDECPYQPSPLPSHVLGARTAVAVVTHKPTPAMLRRWCHLRTERACSSFKANWFILYVVQHAESELNYREWCEGSAPVSVLRKENYTTIYGRERGSLLGRGARVSAAARSCVSCAPWHAWPWRQRDAPSRRNAYLAVRPPLGV